MNKTKQELTIEFMSALLSNPAMVMSDYATEYAMKDMAKIAYMAAVAVLNQLNKEENE